MQEFDEIWIDWNQKPNQGTRNIELEKKTCESNSNCGSLVNQSYKTFFDIQRNRTIVDITTHKSIKQMKMSCFVWCGIIFADYFDSQSNFTWRQTSINRERFIGSTVFSSTRIFFFFFINFYCVWVYDLNKVFCSSFSLNDILKFAWHWTLYILIS